MLFNPDDLGRPLQASPNPLLLAIIPKYLHTSGTNLVKMDFPSETSLAINSLHLVSIVMRDLKAFFDSSLSPARRSNEVDISLGSQD